jgi:uncharacterized protein
MCERRLGGVLGEHRNTSSRPEVTIRAEPVRNTIQQLVDSGPPERLSMVVQRNGCGFGLSEFAGEGGHPETLSATRPPIWSPSEETRPRISEVGKVVSVSTEAASALETLVTTHDGNSPELVGSRCDGCNTVTFPTAATCPCCGGASLSAAVLPTTGTVWTWTVQRFQPKAPYRAPASFEPYAVAYVDLGEVRVEARLAGKTVDAWRIGDPVRLVTGPLDPTVPGYQTFWFEPA